MIPTSVADSVTYRLADTQEPRTHPSFFSLPNLPHLAHHQALTSQPLQHLLNALIFPHHLWVEAAAHTRLYTLFFPLSLFDLTNYTQSSSVSL